MDEETWRQVAERDAALEAALTGRRRQTPEQLAEGRAWWERIMRARRAADVCAECERQIGEAEPVYISKLRLRSHWLRGPVCMDCAPVYIPVWVERDGFGRPCESCGRRVALDYDDLPYDDEPALSRPTGMRHDFCSEVCAYRYYNRIRNERAAAARAGRECQECGREFDAVRSDQRYCSAACKQRAYRQRLKA
jgi:hypothetical protein